jgi:hypothetical protein
VQTVTISADNQQKEIDVKNYAKVEKVRQPRPQRAHPIVEMRCEDLRPSPTTPL